MATAPWGHRGLRAGGNRATGRPGPFARKPTDQLVGDSGDSGLQRSVGSLDLTAIGGGVVIGAGIYVIVGEAIPQSGPAIVLSFVIAGITCIFSALSYAELASSIPVSGSAYTYGYATLWELVAWVIGWNLILEYGLGAATVAVGWAGICRTSSAPCSAAPARRDRRAAGRRRHVQPPRGRPRRRRLRAAGLRRT